MKRCQDSGREKGIKILDTKKTSRFCKTHKGESVMKEEQPAINFDASEKDFELIEKIVERATIILGIITRHKIDTLKMTMDLTATHCNGTPLKLEELLNADRENFLHDLAKISVNLNRHTGKLENDFIPRCAE